jgi:predicted permease
MSVWRKLPYLLPSYRRAQERDMQAELESLAAIAERRELGSVTRAAEEARAAWGWTWLEHFYRDVQYAFRTMRQSPGFTATAVLSLALGIGANTAIFSLIDALMLRWLPVRDPQELVQLKMRTARGTPPGETFSYAIVTAFADQEDIFSGVSGFSGTSFSVGPRGSVNRVSGAWVTGDYYETLGLNPAMGRLLTRADDRPGAPPVAVISYGYWERQFARSPEAIGQSVPMNGVPVTIAGVSPAGFVGANVGAIADVTMPVAALPVLDPGAAGLLGPGNFWLRILARPQRSVSIAQAEARLAIVWPQLSERVIDTGWPLARRKAMAESTFEVVPGGTGYTYLRELFRKPLMVLMAVVALVLLIACANVANLLLARAAARQREISVRLAIGAGRGRIIRQLLTESTLLSSLGAVLGICLAWFTSRFLVGILSIGGNSSGSPFAVVLDLNPNWHVLGFTSAVAIATGVLFGLAPAFQSTAAGPSPVLKDDARMTRSRSRLLSSLVSVQVALSLTLLVGAGLFMRTLQNLLNIDPGFRREGVLLVDVDGRPEGYREARLAAFYQELLDRVRQVPGVVSASISSHTPLSGSTWSEAVAPKGQPVPERDNAIFIAAGPNFFTTMQTPLISGREFDARDQGNANVAVVNQTFATRYFQGRNPVGEYLSATVTRPPSDLRIVGVVRDSITAGLRAAPRSTVYVSYFQRAASAGFIANTTLEIRAAGSLSQAASAIRKELQPSFPNAPVEVRALSDQVARTLVQERLMASLAGGFGALGLLLACVGLYGVLAYSVVRRTKEIGVRMALGAQQSRVVWMVARSALVLVAWGIALGLPAAWIASRWVKSMLFGLTPADPTTIAAAALLLGAAGLAAAYFPARRGARVDPMTALRHE